MTERRQLALLLAGLVGLVAVGFGGAVLFPEGCSELDQLGALELRFADAADALPVEDAAGAAVEDVGAQLGGRDWRGAVQLPEAAELHPSEFGFFVVASTDFTVLRPSIGIASAARGRAGLDVFGAGTSLGLRADDGETAILDSTYDLERCGQLPSGVAVQDVDRGFAAVVDGGGARVVTLSGDAVWDVAGATEVDILGDVTLVRDDAGLQLRSTRTGAPLDRLDAAELRLLASDADGVLAVADGALVDVALTPEGFGTTRALGDAAGVVAAVRTRDGVVVAREGATAGAALLEVVRDGATVGTAPVPAVVLELLVSEDDHLGALVEADGVRALVVYAPVGAAG